MKILLLEDDLILSEVITEHLEYYNYDVTAIYNGVDAESLLFEEKFDLPKFSVKPLASAMGI